MSVRNLFVVILFVASPNINAIYAQQKEDIYQEILDEANKKGLPAIVAFVQSSDERNWKGKVGLTNLEQSTQTDINQSFRIASITKIFTSIIVLQLADENKINLSDAIGKYLDTETLSKIPHVNLITIDHLLSHSSGIYSFTENNNFWKECYFNEGMSRPWEPNEIISYIENKKPVHQPSEPYSKKSYSNTNYILLGMIIEKVTGNSLTNEYQKRIFTPVEMNHTFLEGHDQQNRDPVNTYAVPHSFFLKSAMKKRGIKKVEGSELINLSQEYRFFNSWAWAAGGISSNINDLSSFLAALRNGQLLSKESQKILVSLNSSNDGKNTFFGGTGGSDGIQATMLHVMPADVVIIILINSSGQEQVNLSSVFVELYKAASAP